MKTCSVCKNDITVPHCDSSTCTWCRGCSDRSEAAHEAAKKRNGLG